MMVVWEFDSLHSLGSRVILRKYLDSASGCKVWKQAIITQRITFKLSHRKHYAEHIGNATEPTEFLSKNDGGEVAHQPEQKGNDSDKEKRR